MERAQWLVALFEHMPIASSCTSLQLAHAVASGITLTFPRSVLARFSNLQAGLCRSESLLHQYDALDPDCRTRY